MKGCLLVVVLAACVGSDDPDWGDPEAHCYAIAVDDFNREELDGRMFASGMPADLVLRRNGNTAAAWRFTYDSERRLLAEDTDFQGPTLGGPDGVFDRRRRLAHTATEVVESIEALGEPPGEPMSGMRWDIGGDGRVTRARGPDGGEVRYEVEDGRLLAVVTRALDPDIGMMFERTERYEHRADGWLARRITTDSRDGGGPHTVEYEHVVAGGTRTIRTLGAAVAPVYRYEHDAGGRLARAAVDENGDGADDWIVDQVHDADGAVTVTGARGGSVFRTHGFSAGCRFALAIAPAPAAPRRPGPQWMLVQPAMPAPY